MIEQVDLRCETQNNPKLLLYLEHANAPHPYKTLELIKKGIIANEAGYDNPAWPH